MTEHVDINWKTLGYDYTRIDWNYLSFWKDGAWDDGRLTQENSVTISLGSTALHYAQECFEGLKAQTAKDGRIVLFRPDQNAKRMQAGARGILMPEVPEEKFLNACRQVVDANRRWIPPYGSGAALYLRPVLFGHGDNLGAKPASEYIFAVFGSPVGPYFKQGLRPIMVKVSEYDRVAPIGTGALKVGGNYAAGLAARAAATRDGYADCLYLDPKTRTYIDEIGGTNFFGITGDNRFVTPDSPTILPSITRRTVAEIATRYLDMTVEERLVPIAEISDFVEAGACGTASAITPVGGIFYQGILHAFYQGGQEAGPVTCRLYELLTAIQCGDHEAPEGWIVEI